MIADRDDALRIVGDDFAVVESIGVLENARR
jgi:hypothetical protein